MRRLGWMVPFGWLRRLIVRALLGRIAFRHQAGRDLQVSYLDRVDVCVPFLFNTAACLGVGRVREAVVALEGPGVVRPVVTWPWPSIHKGGEASAPGAFPGRGAEDHRRGVLEGATASRPRLIPGACPGAAAPGAAAFGGAIRGMKAKRRAHGHSDVAMVCGKDEPDCTSCGGVRDRPVEAAVVQPLAEDAPSAASDLDAAPP
jgi:hypothetical protein